MFISGQTVTSADSKDHAVLAGADENSAPHLQQWGYLDTKQQIGICLYATRFIERTLGLLATVVFVSDPLRCERLWASRVHQ